MEDPDAEPPAEPEVGAPSAGSVSVPVSPEQPRLTHSALQRLGGQQSGFPVAAAAAAARPGVQGGRLPSEASATSTVFGYSFQDIITCDDEKLLEIRRKCVKWIKHIDLEISSRKEDEDEEILRLEQEAMRDAMARGERARARDRLLLGSGEGEGAGQAEGGGGDQGGGDVGGDVDHGGGDVDQGGAEEPEVDMEPVDRDEDPDKDRGVEKEGPPSDTSHLSAQSVEDVCGDCGLLPCMCGPTPQVILGAGAEAGAEAEAEADAQAQADVEAYAAFKEREEVEQRPYWVLVCPQCRMKHLWRQGEEPWGECACGVPMTEIMAMVERTRDESSTSSVSVCLQCVVFASSTGNMFPGVPAFCTRLFPVFLSVLHVAQEGPKPKKRRTAADVRQQQFAAKQAALLAAQPG